MSDILSIDVFGGKIINNTKNKAFAFAPFPEFMKTIMDKGGLQGWVKEKLAKR